MNLVMVHFEYFVPKLGNTIEITIMMIMVVMIITLTGEISVEKIQVYLDVTRVTGQVVINVLKNCSVCYIGTRIIVLLHGYSWAARP
jgi:hypothetical protein